MKTEWAQVSYSDFACHWADSRDLEAHAQPLLFLTVSFPCIFIEAIVKVVWQIRSYKYTQFVKYMLTICICHKQPLLSMHITKGKNTYF